MLISRADRLTLVRNIHIYIQYRSEVSEPKRMRNMRIPIRMYANSHTRIRVCPCSYVYGHTCIRVCFYTYTLYTCVLISIYELAYCCFLCNTVVECCFNGPIEWPNWKKYCVLRGKMLIMTFLNWVAPKGAV